MYTDSIGDFINRLRNATHARKPTMFIRSSRMLKSIANVLTQHGFIDSVEEEKFSDKPTASPDLKITFKIDRDPLEVKRVSKPGQRIYVGHEEIKRVKNGLGIAIVSTSQGVMTGDEAKSKKIGGEYLCEIY